MFEELWLLADYYLKCGRVLDAYESEFMKRDPCGEITALKAWFASQQDIDDDLSLNRGRNTRYLALQIIAQTYKHDNSL